MHLSQLFPSASRQVANLRMPRPLLWRNAGLDSEKARGIGKEKLGLTASPE